jgi:polyhydroxybutyrate depolymerase
MAPAKRLALALLLAIAPGAWAAPHGDAEQSIGVDGVTRTFLLHVPQGVDPRVAMPLVVVFHGGGGNAMNAARMSGMDDKADLAQFVVAYPNGTGRLAGVGLLTWNTWECCGEALERGADDVRFVRAMVESISREYGIDPRRIYAAGMSNGAMMAYRVGCELSDVFAAIAPVSGALDTDDCNPRYPVSAIVFHGTADKHIRYDGGKPLVSLDRRHAREDRPVSFAVGFWARHDRCKDNPARKRHGHVIHDTYDCPDGAGVELYAIEGQGHAWPGGMKGLRSGNVDEPSREVDATNLMWEFFAAHPRQ